MTTQKQNGVVEENNGKENSGTTAESRGKENKEQNNCQDDSDEHTDGSEKKKKGKTFANLFLFFFFCRYNKGKGISRNFPKLLLHTCCFLSNLIEKLLYKNSFITL